MGGQRAHQRRVIEVVAALHRIGIELIDRVGDAGLFLLRRFRGIDAAFSTHCIAADHRHFFQNHHFAAEVMERNGCGKARSAGANHNGIGISKSCADGKSQCGGNESALHKVFLLEGLLGMRPSILSKWCIRGRTRSDGGFGCIESARQYLPGGRPMR